MPNLRSVLLLHQDIHLVSPLQLAYLGLSVSPSFGVNVMDPARFSLGPVPSGMFHGLAVAPENLSLMNGHGVTSKVDVVEPTIHGPANTKGKTTGKVQN